VDGFCGVLARSGFQFRPPRRSFRRPAHRAHPGLRGQRRAPRAISISPKRLPVTCVPSTTPPPRRECDSMPPAGPSAGMRRGRPGRDPGPAYHLDPLTGRVYCEAQGAPHHRVASSGDSRRQQRGRLTAMRCRHLVCAAHRDPPPARHLPHPTRMCPAVLVLKASVGAAFLLVGTE
jgi:hypothetical protein